MDHNINIERADSPEQIIGLIPQNRHTVVVMDRLVNTLYGNLGHYYHIVIDAGEESKNPQGLFSLIKLMMEAGCDRETLVVAVGGGTLTDLAGFASSIYMRGVDFILVPTTLLAQADASIGGKNGINVDGYKNIVGVIRQPLKTIIAPFYLNSLSEEALREGFAEMVKSALIGDRHMFEFFEQSLSDSPLSTKLLGDTIARCAIIKAAIVERDPYEKGERIFLNLGHTFAHAIERSKKISHGYAVSQGLVAATALSVRLGFAHESLKLRVKRVLEAASLPVNMDISALEFADCAAKDKKRENNSIKFVLLRDVGCPFVHRVAIDELKEVFDDLR